MHLDKDQLAVMPMPCCWLWERYWLVTQALSSHHSFDFDNRIICTTRRWNRNQVTTPFILCVKSRSWIFNWSWISRCEKNEMPASVNRPLWTHVLQSASTVTSQKNKSSSPPGMLVLRLPPVQWSTRWLQTHSRVKHRQGICPAASAGFLALWIPNLQTQHWQLVHDVLFNINTKICLFSFSKRDFSKLLEIQCLLKA